ncbi:MAG: SRPBCC family protein [Pseudomonadota bacterium]
MASIYKEFVVEADIQQVWDALRDFGALHQRLAPGFITACVMEGDVRAIRFANGMSAREQLLGIHEAAHRLSYTVLGGMASYHHASAQLFELGPGRTRFVWITDVLPDALAGPIGAMMEQGGAAMKAALASATAPERAT